MWVSLCPQSSVLLFPVGMAEERAVWYPKCVVTAGWMCRGLHVTSHVRQPIGAMYAVPGIPWGTECKAT